MPLAVLAIRYSLKSKELIITVFIANRNYITRHYGQPDQNVHAIQLEMSQALYMKEDAPFSYLERRAAKVQPLLQAMLQAALEQLQNRSTT